MAAPGHPPQGPRDASQQRPTPSTPLPPQVTAQGDILAGKWTVSDGMSLTSFRGNTVQLHPRGLLSMSR